MIASFQAKDLRPTDKISVQTLSGRHKGTVRSSPERTSSVSYTVFLSLDCSDCESRHGIDLPGYKIVATERTP